MFVFGKGLEEGGGSWVFVVRVRVGGEKEMLNGYSYPSKVTSPLWV